MYTKNYFFSFQIHGVPKNFSQKDVDKMSIFIINGDGIFWIKYFNVDSYQRVNSFELNWYTDKSLTKYRRMSN